MIPQAYQFCYRLNRLLGVTLQWTFDAAASQLHVAISANSQKGDWVAIGFQPTFPGMNASDIVLGYLSAGGSQCVRSMTAVHYVGTPMDTGAIAVCSLSLSFSLSSSFVCSLSTLCLQVTDSAVLYDGTRTSLQFSRAFDTGHFPIPQHQAPFPQAMPFHMMWAVGSGPIADCTASPHYHGAHRGAVYINWSQPWLVFDDTTRC